VDIAAAAGAARLVGFGNGDRRRWGLELPVEVSATDSFATVTDAPERSLAMVARIAVDLADVLLGEETPFCETLDRCKK